MKVGAIEESITVTGETPVVDVQNTKTQQVLGTEVIAAIPTARNYESMHILVPGVTVAAGSQDVGGSTTNSLVFFTAHGGDPHDSDVLVNGLSIADAQSNGGRSMYVPSAGISQEISVTTSGGLGLGEAPTAGVIVNIIFKDGGNTFKGSAFATGATEGMAGSNYDKDLASQGLKTPNNVKNVYDYEGTFGGPIKKDKLWFFFDVRRNGATNYVAGVFVNQNAGNPNAWTYAPTTEKALFDQHWQTESLRLTWQATQRNKFVVYYSDQLRCVGCDHNATATSTLEANGKGVAHPNNLAQFIWTSVLNSRTLVEAGYGEHLLRYGNEPRDDIWNPSMISVTAQNGSVPGLTYRAPTSITKPWIGNYFTRASLTYTSGSHSMKFGYNGAFHNFTQSNASPQPISYRFTTPDPGGVPNQLTQRLQPFSYWEQLNQWGLYAQDQWTVRRLTLSGGVRYDKFTAYFPEASVGPVPYVPTTFTLAAAETTNLNDFTTRVSAAYDVFGTGKTAVKVTLGKYLLAQDSNGTILGGGAAPMARIASNTTRAWTDRNGNFVPDCNLSSGVANGECGAFSNSTFGQPTIATSLDPAAFRGWGVRPYNWQFDVSLQQQVLPRVSVNVGYFRRWFGNFLVTNNQALTAADYQMFNLPLPADPRLPITGTVNGFFDVNPAKFGQFNNVVTEASNFGDEKNHWNGVDVSANARLKSVQLQGGVSFGKTSVDLCEVAAKLPNVLSTANQLSGVNAGTGLPIPMQYCSWDGKLLTQVKMLGSYTVPRIDVQLAATLQNIPGQELVATYNAPNAVVAPLLGRNLAGNAATTALNLLPPNTFFADRTNQLDFRAAKILKFNTYRFQVSLDLYNALNANTVQTNNSTYSPTGTWPIPTAILPARLAKVSAQFDF